MRSFLIGLFCLMLLPKITTAQNLCPNPGFEQLSGCPLGPSEIQLASPWIAPGDTADLFSFCHVNGAVPGCNDVSAPQNFAGNAAAHGGSCYAGIYTKSPTANSRTYIQAPLSSAMIPGQIYKTEVWFRRSSFSKYATNRLGIVFSTAALAQTGSQVISIAPQIEMSAVIADTGSWTALTSYYAATGGEAHITIGNFRTDAQTTAFNFINPAPACATLNGSAYYYVDDILVTPVSEQISVSGDTIICTGQSTALTGITNTQGYWSLLSQPSDTIPSSNNILTVTPADTTTYLWHGLLSSVPVTVYTVDPPQVMLPADTTVCEGTEIILDATCPGCTYLWSTGANTALLAAADSGMYVVAVNNGGCVSRDTFSLSTLNNPDLFIDDAVICANNGNVIVADAGPGSSWLWSPSADTVQTITIYDAGVYSVTVTHADGCTKSTSFTVTESCPETLYIPGAFTPNADGKNDVWYADGTNVTNFKLMIFNRWGQALFETTKLGFDGHWNGKFEDTAVPAGVYAYLVTYDAIKSNGKFKKLSRAGYFVLIR